ncbi:MAG: GMC family oxidoreductase [Anaerolineales bacterium]
MTALDLPRYADTVVIGGGTSGAAVAGRLAQHTEQSVVVLEAGPDYGAFSAGQWPADLLDARAIPLSHDWGYTSAAATGRPHHPLERARVLGGCSAHNGCIAFWGHRTDYDGWAALGNPGWSTDELLPFFRQVNETLRVRRYAPAEITPFHEACLDAMLHSGHPLVEDLNNLDDDVGASIAAVNVQDGIRWNAAFAYLDPVRSNKRLTIAANVVVDRVRTQAGRATAIDVIGPNGPATIEAGRVVLCAGAYGSPAILLRSGIGPADELRTLGIEPITNLPGVGRNLHDHPGVYLQFSGTPRLIENLQAFSERGNTLVAEQSLAKLRSAHCSAAFDLHIFPVGGQAVQDRSRWEFTFPVANMTPLSRGTVTLRDRDPIAAPVIDTGYLTDPADADLDVLLSGIDVVREITRQPALAELLGEEISPSAHYTDRESVRRDCLHYFHPVGTCKMGPASDPMAVVDALGNVHGFDNLYVADTAIMPTIPRANTNIPVLVVAERIVDWLLAQA